MPRRSLPTTGLVGLTSLLCLVGTALVATGPAQARPLDGLASSTPAERQLARVRVPRLDWHPCTDLVEDERVTCAEVRVPLDYDHPRGPQTTLAVAKVRGNNASRGAIFVNPGGPGGPARPFALAAGRLLGQRVDRYYDIIGIDPRGTGGSGATTCSGSIPGLPFARYPYPIGERQVRRQVQADDNLRQLCRTGRTRLVDHATTADNARDMELVRRALGRDQLSYYGISYGSYLGATYAAMFPRHIRAMVVDGVLDPVAWSTGRPGRPATAPFTTRLKSGRGSFEALTAAFAECDRVGRRHCPLAPDSAAAFHRVYHRAATGRLAVREDGETFEISPQELISFGLGALYDGRYLPGYFQFLRMLDRRAGSGAAAARVAERREAARLYHRLVRIRDRRLERGLYSWAPRVGGAAARARWVRGSADVVFQAVGCSDARNPRDPRAWEQAAAVTDYAVPWFGRLWTYASSSCAKQGIGSGTDAFRGPWSTRTSYPLLVVGNVHDPATPISGARRVNSLFAGSVLLTYDGWGHGALGVNACIRTRVADYLTRRQLPPDGTVCKQGYDLFH